MTSTQSNEGERQDSRWIISGEVVLAGGRAPRHQETCLPDAK